MRRCPEVDVAPHARWVAQATLNGDSASDNTDLWAANTWILHAMYENPALAGLGTYDEWEKRGMEVGDVEPCLVGGIDVNSETMDTGMTLGYVSAPEAPWRRLAWADLLARTGGSGSASGVPPCFRWFAASLWSIDTQPPPEGSLDEESLVALLSVLGSASQEGAETPCFALYDPLAAGDFTRSHLWWGPLRSVPELIGSHGGAYRGSPTFIWPTTRDWLVWTDWDLSGTKVSGSHRLIAMLDHHAHLETIRWP